MLDLIKSGNFQAAKYVLDNLGYQPETNVNISTDEIKITIEDD